MNITARTIALAQLAGGLLFANMALGLDKYNMPVEFAEFYGVIALGFMGAALASFIDYRREYYLNGGKSGR